MATKCGEALCNDIEQDRDTYETRISTALADLDDTEARCRALHHDECLCGSLALRMRGHLVGLPPAAIPPMPAHTYPWGYIHTRRDAP